MWPGTGVRRVPGVAVAVRGDLPPRRSDPAGGQGGAPAPTSTTDTAHTTVTTTTTTSTTTTSTTLTTTTTTTAPLPTLGAQAQAVQQANLDGAQRLRQAIGANDLAQVQAVLLQAPYALHAADRRGWTPILSACKYASADTVRWLIGRGARITDAGPFGLTCLHMAAINKDHPDAIGVLRQALSAGAFREMANTPDQWGARPVALAAECGQPDDVVNALQLTRVAPPFQLAPTSYRRGWLIVGSDHEDADYGPLAAVGRQGGIEMMTCGDGRQGLSWKGLCALNIQPGDFVVAEFHSVWIGHLQRVMVVLSEDEMAPWVDVARLLFEKGVATMLLLGCDIARTMEPLRRRFQHDPGIPPPFDPRVGHRGLGITLVGREGETLRQLNRDAMRLFLEDGAMRRQHGVGGDALQRRSVQAMQTLVWDDRQGQVVVRARAALTAHDLHGVPPAQADKARRDLLLLHVWDNDLAQARALVQEHHVDPHTATDSGGHALLLACERGHLGIADWLVRMSVVQVNAADKKGNTPLLAASEHGHTEVVGLLLGCGALIHQANNEAFTGLHFASMNGHLAVVRLLMAGGARIHQPTDDGETPLWLASSKGHVAVVQALLDHGAEVDQADDDGVSPLQAATNRGHVSVARVLQQAVAGATDST